MSVAVTDLPRLFSDLIRLEIELWNAVDRRLHSEHQLPLSWFEALQVVSRHPHCRVHDIADELGITVGGTSKLVDRIEAAGLCQRQPNPNDRRSSIIDLTDRGARLLTRAAATFAAELERRFAPLSDRERGELAATLTTLRTAGRALDHPRQEEPSHG